MAAVSSARTSATTCWPAATRWSASTTSRPAAGPTWPTWSTIPASRWWRRTSPWPSRWTARSTGCSTWPVRRRPPTTWPCRSRPWPWAARAPAAGWNWPSAHGARFLLASTSEVYGDPDVHPQTESYWGNVNSVGPRSVYDEAKRFAEALTMAHHRQLGTDVAIVRIFNTYGPRLRPDDGRVVSNFLVQALQGEPLTVYGDGSQTRSLCYVDDEVRGLLALFDSELTGPVNIGNPDEYTVLELAQTVIELSGLALARRPPPAAGGRPYPPPPGHHPGPHGPRVGADHRPPGGTGPHRGRRGRRDRARGSRLCRQWRARPRPWQGLRWPTPGCRPR